MDLGGLMENYGESEDGDSVRISSIQPVDLITWFTRECPSYAALHTLYFAAEIVATKKPGDLRDNDRYHLLCAIEFWQKMFEDTQNALIPYLWLLQINLSDAPAELNQLRQNMPTGAW